jgi:hypothetical protein
MRSLSLVRRCLAGTALGLGLLTCLPLSAETLDELDTLSDISADEEAGINAASEQAGRGEYLEALATLEREREAKRAGQITSSSDARVQEFRGADYFLTGKLSGLSTASRGAVSDYILYTFQLINARTGEIVWGGDDEIKKQGQSDAVYR